ncbi:MAG: glycerophosphodiester phosphodiesterase family protein [Bacilli bacterium]|jgi:glycerophosphoryl diester phosphodiesterase
MKCQRMKNEALLAPFLVHPIAHRGLHNENIDENSLASFKEAIKNRYAIEIDVHLTKDYEVVVLHDSTLERVTGSAGKVEKMTINEIKRCSLLKTKEKIPLLWEVLELVNGQVPLLIELKVVNNREPLADAVIKTLENYRSKTMIAIQSFDPVVMRYLRKKYPKAYAYGQLASRDIGNDQPFHVRLLFKTMLVNWISKPNFTAYDITYLPQRKIKFIRRKMPVLTWTIDHDEKYQRAAKYADNVIFEHIIPRD